MLNEDDIVSVVFIADKDCRYEYVDGHAIAIGTPSDEHQDIALILGSNLREHLRGQNCKVRLAAASWTRGRVAGRERRPDVMVTCDAADLTHGTRLKRHPQLIVEILSPNEGDDLKANSTNTKRSRPSRNTSSSTRRCVFYAGDTRPPTGSFNSTRTIGLCALRVDWLHA